MDDGRAISELKALVTEGKEKILTTKWIAEGVIGARAGVDEGLYSGWYTRSLAFLKLFLNDDSEYIKSYSTYSKNYYNNARDAIAVLEGVIDHIEKGFISLDSAPHDIELDLYRIFTRFHKVARQIRDRYNNRNTLDINDEYDIQDLIHALLKLYFDDIRAEEWTPSYAGKSARVDFLLKKEGIIIEIKKTRNGLKDKELGDQLIIDVDRYKVHPDCKKIWCFVYDPEGKIGNPEGLISDLEEQHNGFVKVIIEP